jgi:hypothetical protein
MEAKEKRKVMHLRYDIQEVRKMYNVRSGLGHIQYYTKYNRMGEEG